MATTHPHPIRPIREDASEETATPDGFQTSKAVVIASGHFTHDLFTSSIAPLLPLIIQKLSLSLALAGTLASLQQIPSLIDPLLGALTDRGRLRWLIILAPSISALGIVMIGLAPSYALVALLLLAVGISTAIWHTSGPALIARVSGNQIGKGMSFFMVGGSLAFTLGPLVVVAGVSWWGLAGIWRLLPLALAVSALLYWQTRDLEAFQSRQANPNVKWGASWQTLKPVMLPLTGILMTQAFMQVAVGTYLPTYLSEQGASFWIAGASFSIYELAGTLGTAAIGPASDRFGRRRILAISLLLAPPLMLLFMITADWLQIVVLLALGFASLSSSPILMALVQEYSPDHRATANGLYFAVMFAGRSLIIILVGAAADRLGLQTAFYVTALLGFLALPFVRLLPGEQVDFSPENL